LGKEEDKAARKSFHRRICTTTQTPSKKESKKNPGHRRGGTQNWDSLIVGGKWEGPIQTPQRSRPTIQTPKPRGERRVEKQRGKGGVKSSEEGKLKNGGFPKSRLVPTARGSIKKTLKKDRGFKRFRLSLSCVKGTDQTNRGTRVTASPGQTKDVRAKETQGPSY